MPTIRTPTAKAAPLDTSETEAIIKRPVVEKTGNYNLTAAHNREFHELADGITAVLPTASGSLTETDDWFVILKALGATGATIDPNGQTVDGSSSNITLEQYETILIAMNHDQTAFLKFHRETTVSAVEAALGLGTSATVDTGTSGATIPLLNANNTHSGNNTFSGTNTFSGSVALSSSTTVDGSAVARFLPGPTDATTFPLGTILAVYTNSTDFGRTNTNAIKKSSGDAYSYVDSSQAGTTLTGTWMSRGRCGYSFSSDKHYLFQRTA